MYVFLVKIRKKTMKSIFILAFVLIGMVSNAQEIVPIDSMQVGDIIKFEKKCKDISDIYGEYWTFYKGSGFVISYVARDEDGHIMYFRLARHSGGEVEVDMLGTIILDIRKKRVSVCR